MRARWWALGATFGYASLTALGPGFGRSGRDDRERSLPGDDVLERPTLAATYSTVIDADPEAVWPWVVQIAQGHIRRAAAQHEERSGSGTEHKVGIVTFAPCRALVMRSTSTTVGRGRSSAQIDWVWAFVLDDLGDGRTHVVLRLSSAARPWRAAVVRRILAVPGESVRVRRLMAGLARRATRDGGAAGAVAGPTLEAASPEDPSA